MLILGFCVTIAHTHRVRVVEICFLRQWRKIAWKRVISAGCGVATVDRQEVL